jgi:hypothetical protein
VVQKYGGVPHPSALRVRVLTLSFVRPDATQGRKDLFYPYGKTFLQTLGEQD